MLRSAHPFGALSLAHEWTGLYTDQVIQDRFELAVSMLDIEREQARAETERWRWARGKLQNAYQLLRSPSARWRLEKQLKVRDRPIVLTLRCPVDVLPALVHFTDI